MKKIIFCEMFRNECMTCFVYSTSKLIVHLLVMVKVTAARAGTEDSYYLGLYYLIGELARRARHYQGCTNSSLCGICMEVQHVS